MVLVSLRVWVRVRVWLLNQGTSAVKVKSRDCSLANDLVNKTALILDWWFGVNNY